MNEAIAPYAKADLEIQTGIMYFVLWSFSFFPFLLYLLSPPAPHTHMHAQTQFLHLHDSMQEC